MVGAVGTAGKRFEVLYLALRLGDVVVECRMVFANPHTAKERVVGICNESLAPSPIGQTVLNTGTYKERKAMIEFKCILVPLDGSPLAERALPLAKALALKFESQVILLRVLDIPTPTIPAFHPEIIPSWVSEAREQAYQEAERYLKTWQAELRQQGFEVRILLRDTSPAEDIIDAAIAEDVDLIVMSTHGRGGLARWTFGGVADKVARHSPCPVLLVRQGLETANES
jgi:nucleotide-binding universal stress UspA family protein